MLLSSYKTLRQLRQYATPRTRLVLQEVLRLMQHTNLIRRHVQDTAAPQHATNRKYSSTHLTFQNLVSVSGQLHAPADLHMVKNPGTHTI